MLEVRIHGHGGQGAQVGFAHLDESAIAQIQVDVARRWDALLARVARAAEGPSTEPSAALSRAH